MSDRPLHEVLTESAHPDPEGHLTDITISKLRDLRDNTVTKRDQTLALLKEAESQGSAEGHQDARVYGAFVMSDDDMVHALNNILEPWGEGPTD